jgi:hypothetical protein
MNTESLIKSLSTDVKPVKAVFGPIVQLVVWFVFSILIVLHLTTHTGDFRPGFAQQLIDNPRFFLETSTGIVTAILAALTGIVLAIPGAAESKFLVALTSTMLVIWFSLFLYGLIDPALTPSMMGKRPTCFSEVFLFSGPPILILVFLLRRGVTILRNLSGVFLAISACLLPSSAMQVACMYDPVHNLKFHVLPVLVMAILGLGLGVLALRKP